MSITIIGQKDNIRTIELIDGEEITIQMNEGIASYEFKFFKDGDLEEPFPDSDIFLFTDESANPDDDEDDFVFNPSLGQRYLARAMFVPSEFQRMGVGEFILQWLIEVTKAEIWARNPDEGKVGDESDLTQAGRHFVFSMQQKGLISEWD